MRQIELHNFFNRGGGVTKWKPELYSEYFGYEAIWAEIHSVSDIFFQSVTDRKLSLSSPRYAICFIVTMHMQHISHMSHIYTTWTRYSVNS